MQRKCKSGTETPSLIERYAEMKPFLCKDKDYFIKHADAHTTFIFF